MARRSAGVLLYRVSIEGSLEVLLVHPGGPLWAKRDEGAWSIPKGEYGEDEDPMAVARREFAEELGSAAPDGPWLDLGTIRQAGGKRVTAWAVLGDLDVSTVVSNTFEMPWPPNSGKHAVFPEVDRAEWFSVRDAEHKIIAGQSELLDRLVRQIEPGR
ncbi:MAG: NUDIX domain-containing protein [Acidimicrobiia bacterium]